MAASDWVAILLSGSASAGGCIAARKTCCRLRRGAERNALTAPFSISTVRFSFYPRPWPATTVFPESGAPAGSNRKPRPRGMLWLPRRGGPVPSTGGLSRPEAGNIRQRRFGPMHFHDDNRAIQRDHRRWIYGHEMVEVLQNSLPADEVGCFGLCVFRCNGRLNVPCGNFISADGTVEKVKAHADEVVVPKISVLLFQQNKIARGVSARGQAGRLQCHERYECIHARGGQR